MTGKMMQCCYTNAVKETGGKTSSGWQAVVASEDLPPEAYAACINLQRANSRIQSHMVDEKGNVLNLFEIDSDGAYVYVIRTQYGLTDRLGRPNMFSHAYIFSWKQEGVMGDPNVFLSLTEDWFAKDEESARRPKDTLKPGKPFTLEGALARAGMTAETYQTLLQCVYAQYSEKKASKPVYVQYDGTEEQMRAILYVIYCGLPYCVRRNLSIASSAAGTTNSHHLIFSTDAAGNGSFVVPQTGENSVLTPRMQRKIARYGFVEYAARHYSEMDVNDYFRELEQLAVELGDPAASDELTLKIAHQLREGLVPAQLQGAELDSVLSDALRSKSHGSPRMERQISDMLDAVCRLGMSLTEENEANLAQWLVRPVTTELENAGERYHIYRLGSLSPEEGARLLHGYPKRVFDRYSGTLLEEPGGERILDCFYAAYGLEGGEVTWEALNALLDRAQGLPVAEKTRECIDAAAWKLYREQLEEPGEARRAERALMELMRRMYEGDQLDQCGARAREIYWSDKTLQSFSLDRIDEYRGMCADTQWCRIFMDFSAVLEAYRRSDDEAFFRELNKFAVEYEHAFDPPWQPQPFLEKLEIELMVLSPRVEVLSGWIRIVALPEAERAVDDILVLRGQLYQSAFDDLVATYQKIVGENYSYTGSNTLVDALSALVEEECRRADGPEKPVPVDVWLALGKSRYPENAFRIFDKGAAGAACLGDPHAADESGLFGAASVIRQAEEYAQGKGKTAKIVRKWIQARKHKQSGERKAGKEESGSTSRWNIASLLPQSIFSQRTDRGSRPGHHGSGRYDRREEAGSVLMQACEESGEVIPAGAALGENVPKETAPEESVLERTVPEEGFPNGAAPEKGFPEETAPEGFPERAAPEESAPDERGTTRGRDIYI